MDGNNDVFKVYGNNIESMNIIIFNRWGEMIFESEDQNSGWDGTYKEKLLNPATFIYVLKVKTIDGETIKKKGDINLIR